MKNKIRGVDELTEIVAQRKRQGCKIVFTNGCFDLLHVGHVRILQEARRLGDVLVVGLNSDSSVRALKGEGRPIVPENERAEILAAMECTDYVVIFHELTPERLLARLKPDIHVKGGDYVGKLMPEREIIEGYGGKVVLVPLVSGHSTTRLLARVRCVAREGVES